MSTESFPPLRGSVTVNVPLERAFQFFTGSLTAWWPAGYHIGAADMAEVVLEPRVGGRWFEIGVDGSECEWGRVLTWEPPHRVVITWQINGEWKFDPDPAHASEVDVRFTADGPHRTTVEITHDHIDRLVGAKSVYDGFIEGGSWPAQLDRFAKALVDSQGE
jgi:uncharacterized protein YndB with AHSA1/START domain